MVWLPAGNVELVRVAMPPERVPVPITVDPSKKVTAPVGKAVPVVPFTLAVSVSAEPLWTLFDDAVSTVLVLTIKELILM
jgi:hypothetical protein